VKLRGCFVWPIVSTLKHETKQLEQGFSSVAQGKKLLTSPLLCQC